jgi:hypothetical protein
VLGRWCEAGQLRGWRRACPWPGVPPWGLRWRRCAHHSKGSGAMPKDPERQPFYCPYPGASTVRVQRCMSRPSRPQRQAAACTHAGCKRKFASLWRLKVHYRAPPNERGSGKERGHGVELPICPACGEDLEPGKHHNKCKAGRTTNPPSKRVPKTGAAAAKGAKNCRSGRAAKKPPKRETHPAGESNSGNSFDGNFLPAQGTLVAQPHEGLHGGQHQHGAHMVRCPMQN